MPSNISNALGTERQYMPRPENVYQGRYRDPQAQRVFYDPNSQDRSLGRNMARLSDALNRWDLTHEKHLDQRGFQQAQDMVRGMTPEDMKKLGTIDAAQQYGYADDTANPYFRAYADKLRGSYLAVQMRKMFDEKYANNPAQSMDEEAQRYTEFADEFKQDVYDKLENPHAFDVGYAEKNIENISDLWGKWQKKKREEDVNIAVADSSNTLGTLIANAPDIMNQYGEEVGTTMIAEQAQEAFNVLKLAGAPLEMKIKVANDWIMQMASTGHMTEKAIRDLTGLVSIQTLMSGEDINLDKVINLQDIVSASAAFRKDVMDEETFTMLKEYIESENPMGFLAKVEQTIKENPEKGKYYAQFWPFVYSQSEARRKAREAEDRRQMEADRKAKEKAREEALKNQNADLLLSTWQSGNPFLPDGRPITELDVEKKYLEPRYNREYLRCIAAGDFDGVSRLLSMPHSAASEFKGLIKADMISKFNLLTLDNLDKNPDMVGIVMPYIEYAMARPNDVEAYLGTEVAKEAKMLSLMKNINLGDVKAGARDYAIWKSTPEDEKTALKANIKGLINETVYTIDEMNLLAGGKSTDPIILKDNPLVMEDVVLQAALLMKKGFGQEDSLNTAADNLRNNYRQWRHAIFPYAIVKEFTAMSGIADGSEYYIRAALEDFAGDYENVRYNSATRSFVFGDSNQHNINLGNLYENALAIAIKQGEAPTPPQQVESNQDAADRYNAARADDAAMTVGEATKYSDDYVYSDTDFEQDMPYLMPDITTPVMRRNEDPDSIPTPKGVERLIKLWTRGRTDDESENSE